MAYSIKTPQNYNEFFTFNAARLLKVMQLLDVTQDQTMLNLLKLSASLPKIHDNSKMHNVPLSKEELQTITEIRACMNDIKGSENEELNVVLDDISKLFAKIEAIPQVKENLVKIKAPTNVSLAAEDMDYAINRYLYTFTPPKPAISEAEAETLLKYIHEHKPKLTAHSVLVLQNVKHKTALGTATAAMSKVVKRRTSSTASEQTIKAADSPPRAASPENLVSVGFKLEYVFPPPEVSGMPIPPPPLPRRSYRKSAEKRLSAGKTVTKPTPALPTKRPSIVKAAAPIAKPVIEATKPPAPMVPSKQERRISFPKGDGGATMGTGLPTPELADKLQRRLEKSKPQTKPRSTSPGKHSM